MRISFWPRGIIVCMIATLLFISCGEVNVEKIYRNGIVVCSDRIAADVGLRVLQEGGNAIDAAVATAFTMAVTLPRAGNIGGGGFALIYMADSQEVHYLDFRETAPTGIKAELYFDSLGNVDRKKATIGPLSSGTPGTVAGLYEMHQRFGSIEWPSLIKPARYLADTGFAIYGYLAESLSDYSEDLQEYQSTSQIFFNDGNPYIVGDQLVQKELAWTLESIEKNGRDGFYRGAVADKISEFCLDNGGLITQDDLQNYHAVWREPIRFKFRDLEVFASGLPSSGGIVMGQILSILDGFELGKYTADSPEFLHLYTEASRRAFADREKYLGDPDFIQDFSKGLLDESYIASRIQSIDEWQASPSTDIRPGIPKSKNESAETTHIVISDDRGNVVSFTYTINLSYGSKAVVPECGFLLNNEMDDFAINPGQPNAFGLVGGEANIIEPGKRMLSSMTPTIVLRDGKPYMALGSRGGSKIISAVAMTIICDNVFKMSIIEAVLSPRIHHQWLPDVLYLEQDRYGAETIQELIRRGHTVEERSPMGTVSAIRFSDDGIFISGQADSRMPGTTVNGY